MHDSRLAVLTGEMADARLRDPRLSRRLAFMVERLAQRPAASFPNVFDSAGLEAAYRFIGNVAVTPDGILSGHFAATQKRSVAASRVLVVHDSTTLKFRDDGERRGLGRMMTAGQAFFAHVSLVLAADGTRRPLGVAALKTWVRGAVTKGDEHLRWHEQVELAASRVEGAEHVHVMDREADDFALFARLDGKHRFIVRATHDRLLLKGDPDEPRKLNDVLARIERTVEREASLSKRVDGARSPKQKAAHPSRPARLAKLAVGAARVTLKRPTTQEGGPQSVAVNVVRVWEPEAPANEAPIEWVLYTTEPIDTPEELDWVVDSYRARWTIEEFFKALKTGCAYESKQFEDYEGLVNALAVFLPIACNLLEVRSEARRAPSAPATSVLSEAQLAVLRAVGRTRLPEVPSVRDAFLAVAALGGHLKHSGEPGWLTLARGYTELLTLTRGWELRDELQCGRDQG